MDKYKRWEQHQLKALKYNIYIGIPALTILGFIIIGISMIDIKVLWYLTVIGGLLVIIAILLASLGYRYLLHIEKAIRLNEEE